MTDDLLTVIPDAELTRDYCSRSYYVWEQEIATPALIQRGYEVVSWYTSDGDSFGPLVRAVVVRKDGVETTLYYG